MPRKRHPKALFAWMIKIRDYAASKLVQSLRSLGGSLPGGNPSNSLCLKQNLLIYGMINFLEEVLLNKVLNIPKSEDPDT
jgi:hypothetical protein